MLDNAGMATVPREAAVETDILILQPEHRVDGAAAGNLVSLFEPARRPDAPIPVVDEGAMRELVRHMVRDELRGSFGERLTRQIRGVVRREVLRLMGARDAD